MAVRSIRGPSSCTSVARPHVDRVSRKRGWTPSARPAVRGEVFLSRCWLVSVDAGLRKMAIKERKKELINKPIIRNESPCRSQLNATSSPLGPATPVSLTTYEAGLVKHTSTNQDTALI